MNLNQLNTIVTAKNRGCFRKMAWSKNLKSKKGYEQFNIQKITEATVRLGVPYKNMQPIKQRDNEIFMSTGQRPSHELPWGKWVSNDYLIEHKGAYYLRVAPVWQNPYRTKYFCNGQPCSKETAQKYCLASEFSDTKKDAPLVMTVKVDGIDYLK